MVENRCAHIRYDISIQNHCKHPGKVQRDGEWWCGQHDPERLLAKARARTKYIQAEQKALDVLYAARDKITALVEKHPDFQKLNAKVKATEDEYQLLLKGRTKVGLHSYGGRSSTEGL